MSSRLRTIHLENPGLAAENIYYYHPDSTLKTYITDLAWLDVAKKIERTIDKLLSRFLFFTPNTKSHDEIL